MRMARLQAFRVCITWSMMKVCTVAALWICGHSQLPFLCAPSLHQRFASSHHAIRGRLLSQTALLCWRWVFFFLGLAAAEGLGSPCRSQDDVVMSSLFPSRLLCLLLWFPRFVLFLVLAVIGSGFHLARKTSAPGPPARQAFAGAAAPQPCRAAGTPILPGSRRTSNRWASRLQSHGVLRHQSRRAQTFQKLYLDARTPRSGPWPCRPPGPGRQPAGVAIC